MEEITGEADYVNAPEGPADKKAPRPDDTKKGSAPEGTVDTKASPPGLRFVLPIAVCWIILLAIMGLRIYLKECRPCEMNWRYREPSCYSFNDVGPTERLTWEEAREYCRALNADLAAAHNLTEKNIINYYSISTDGSWIGLRVKDGKWKWEDGSDLTNSSWVDPPTEGHCAISVLRIQTWLSMSCDQKQQWICQKKALSV
ncbi:C-type lectin domain family 1 member B-like [Gymnodraco acuticeps]|uniref:C-type lectin domain family 1 member B-like n=1 Tax=Gymnodraco acuticeps TaxID=8218 RepID=A0A6P8T5I4_GYMAC|nr:C-type lectin domain family 1 member B-like [Gymnodraco acuticeps]